MDVINLYKPVAVDRVMEWLAKDGSADVIQDLARGLVLRMPPEVIETIGMLQARIDVLEAHVKILKTPIGHAPFVTINQGTWVQAAYPEFSKYALEHMKDAVGDIEFDSMEFLDLIAMAPGGVLKLAEKLVKDNAKRV